MANEYEVPVWFRISANNTDEAWWKVRQIIAEMETYDQLPPHVVEEPVPLLAGEQGWNPDPTGYTPVDIPPEEC